MMHEKVGRLNVLLNKTLMTGLDETLLLSDNGIQRQSGGPGVSLFSMLESSHRRPPDGGKH